MPARGLMNAGECRHAQKIASTQRIGIRFATSIVISAPFTQKLSQIHVRAIFRGRQVSFGFHFCAKRQTCV